MKIVHLMATTHKLRSDREKKILVFFDYWTDLPLVKKIPSKEHIKSSHQHIRKAIMELLARGIKDVPPGKAKETTRHVLSAREIHDELVNSDGLDLTMPNLYFHLQKLEDIGHIQVVDTISTGKRNTTYYGRVAKVLLIKDFEPLNDYPILNSPEILLLLNKLNPNLSSDQIKETIKSVNSLNKYSEKEFIEWVEVHEKILNQVNMNFLELRDLFGLIVSLNEDVVNSIKELGKLLKM